jgi:hypothetical protein
MSENENEKIDTLPILPEKELLAMNQLMAEKDYRIKVPFSFLRPDRSDKINPDFILYTLNDFLGHLQQCIASTRKMLPVLENRAFYSELESSNPLAASLVSVVHSIDIKNLGSRLVALQKTPRDVTVSDLIPFTKTLFAPLVRVYYLGPSGVSRQYRVLYQCVSDKLEPSGLEGLKEFTTQAIDEWYFIFNQIFPVMFPLVLRMCSSRMLTFNQLYYANGSKVLAWLGLKASDVLILKKDAQETEIALDSIASAPVTQAPVPEIPENALPEDVQKGIAILERLFPEAGWKNLDELPDMCPYFQPILQFQDAFTQLSPDNPLHQTMIMFWILEELFQGLRLIKFEPLEAISAREDVEDINKILEDWILYQEMIFDKAFAADLKEYTHQIYTQPDYNKNPYGRKLLSNMYSLIKHMFLPWFNIQMYGTVKAQKDDRLPPFFIRVARLRRLLSRYYAAIESAPPGTEQNPEGSVPGVINPWAIYKFDISNPVSRRLDAICGGKHSKTRTNALLIEYTLAILEVLNWWVNDKKSFAYTYPPEYLYRVVEPGSAVPAFGVTSRTDVDALFMHSLKSSNQ